MNTASEIAVNAAKAYGGAKYDAAAKELFLNPEIIAPILKEVVPEFKNCSAKEVLGYIIKDSIREDKAVDAVSQQAALNTLPTEMFSVSDKLIRYDAHFKVVNPVLSNGELIVYLHIDLEVQNDYKPSNPAYPVIKRAIYYGARDLSAQLGVLTETTDYDDLQKAYSIWICNENIPAQMRNTISLYSMKKQDVYGRVDEPEEDYDLLTVIIVRRGGKEDSTELFEYLNGIFEGDIEKMRKFVVDIDNNEKVLKGVEEMTGLGDSIFLKGYQKGTSEGYLEALQALVSDGLLTLSEAAKRAGMTESEFSALLEERKK